MSTLLLDIETVPATATVGMDLGAPPGWTPAPFEPPPLPERGKRGKHITRPETIAKWEAEEDARHAAALAAHADTIEAARAAHVEADRAAAEKWYRAQSLDPLHGRVLCLGYAIGDEDPAVIEGDEVDILDEYARLLAFCRPRRFVAHNGHGFDFPFLRLRALKHGRHDVSAAMHQDKPWDERLIDTAQRWPTTGYRGRQSSSAKLDDIAAFLGIARPDNPFDGSRVLDAYVAGQGALATVHCLDDIRVLREVYRATCRLRGEAA